MDSLSLLSVCIVSLFCCSSLIQAQQLYVGKASTDCSNTVTSNTLLGYSCNGLNPSCQGYLIFRSQTSYYSVTTISALLSSDPSELARINSVPEYATFEINKPVIVPVNCSCSGQYYQVNSSYSVGAGDTLFAIANSTYEGLSTCHAIEIQNGDSPNLSIGQRLTVPVRCACPTKSQTDAGIKYLLSYTVESGDSVSSIADRFHASTQETLVANTLPDSNIYPFTTLLIPLGSQPSTSQTTAPPPPPSSPTTPISTPTKSSKKKTWVYIVSGVLAGFALLLLCGAIVFCLCFRKSKKKSDSVIISRSYEVSETPLKKKMKSVDESLDLLSSIDSIATSLKVYKFDVLQSATGNFSSGSLIKGSVYCGMINGDYAAIKKVNGDVSKEINLLNKINHSSLIRLSGISYNDGNWYLVYEYAVNGPLSDWIYYSNGNGKYLSWTQRIQIAFDVATGLNYLHSFTNPPYIHKDIKSSNVMLDNDFRGKIANFTLARSADGEDGQFALTRHIVGTKGYMAPEYLENGFISTKLDVYAFGVLLLEIITGKEAAALSAEQYMDSSDALSRFLDEENKESLRKFIDPAMAEDCPSEHAVFVVKLIISCLKKGPASRPAMDEIVQSLCRTLSTSLAWEASRKQNDDDDESSSI